MTRPRISRLVQNRMRRYLIARGVRTRHGVSLYDLVCEALAIDGLLRESGSTFAWAVANLAHIVAQATAPEAIAKAREHKAHMAQRRAAAERSLNLTPEQAQARRKRIEAVKAVMRLTKAEKKALRSLPRAAMLAMKAEFRAAKRQGVQAASMRPAPSDLFGVIPPTPRRTPRTAPAQTSQDDLFFRSYAWRRLRYESLKVSGARCACCTRTAADGHEIAVRHMKPRGQYPELALSAANLEVLCAACAATPRTCRRESETGVYPKGLKMLILGDPNTSDS